MKEEWLYNILRNGTLVDNQTYTANIGHFYNRRLENEIVLLERQKRQKKGFWNDSPQIWHFLNTTNHKVNKILSSKKNDALVLFNNKEYEHNTDDNFIDLTGSDCFNFTLKTGNLIGYVKEGAYALKISSRYGDKFLKHIISDADGFLELENSGGSTENNEGYDWLLVYLWKTKLKKAFRLGLPKQYRNFKERINRVKGQIDPVEYFLNKNDTNYLCDFREQSYDNLAAQLITEVFHKLQNNQFISDLHQIRNTFVTATKGVRYRSNALLKTPHFTNPFYFDYNDVIDLSKLILKDQFVDFGDKSENSAFFFDISMLFEYYIRKLIIRSGLFVQSKFERRLEIPTGSLSDYRRKLEPDLVIEENDSIFVLDVKYKYYDFKYGVKREDLFQLHTYLGQYGNSKHIKACGFIYPLPEYKWERNKSSKQTYIKDEIIIMGKKIPFFVLFLLIPKDANDSQFHKELLQSGKNLTAEIKTIMGEKS